MLNLDFVKCEYDDVGRIYCFKSGERFYSATTAMGATADHDYLEAWRSRIGDEEADKQCATACDLGEQYHLLGEYYLQGKPLPTVSVLPSLVFKKTAPILRNNVTAIHGIESVLYSDICSLAGRADAVVDWNDELAILDFKFLKHFKKEWIHDYWLQLCLYAHMWHRMTGNLPKKLVLVIGNKRTFESKFFVGDYHDHQKETAGRIEKFHKTLD